MIQKKAVWDLEKRIAALAAQNAELLAACEGALEEVTWYITGDNISTTILLSVAHNLEAAIKNAKGGE